MSGISEVFHYLNGKIFYLATVEGDRPKVRPFGFIMEHEGKLYFGTAENKPVYQQLKANPSFEISATAMDGNEWIRLWGKAVFDPRPEVRVKALESAPYLKDLYDIPESPDLKLFYLAEGQAAIQTMGGAPRKITL
jgi:uncharacterized pyridoxamine 5'-phosphate oxidase family protein